METGIDTTVSKPLPLYTLYDFPNAAEPITMNLVATQIYSLPIERSEPEIGFISLTSRYEQGCSSWL